MSGFIGSAATAAKRGKLALRVTRRALTLFTRSAGEAMVRTSQNCRRTRPSLELFDEMIRLQEHRITSLQQVTWTAGLRHAPWYQT